MLSEDLKTEILQFFRSQKQEWLTVSDSGNTLSEYDSAITSLQDGGLDAAIRLLRFIREQHERVAKVTLPLDHRSDPKFREMFEGFFDKERAEIALIEKWLTELERHRH